ncbi:hypothetical protein HOLleu_22641 [Holothuria leucospilota]|uniref:Uncharacterized protein n=1 Tax=Holothuria leucospilota TaxID=206669 RepID=A0A9Q1BYV0_HOLLE|nr:hypothetical protein HOLleu_22641 [Holothuria leucospilota]
MLAGKSKHSSLTSYAYEACSNFAALLVFRSHSYEFEIDSVAHAYLEKTVFVTSLSCRQFTGRKKLGIWEGEPWLAIISLHLLESQGPARTSCKLSTCCPNALMGCNGETPQISHYKTNVSSFSCQRVLLVQNFTYDTTNTESVYIR